MTIFTPGPGTVDTHGVNWVMRVQRNIPLTDASDARVSDWLNARPFDWLSFMCRITRSGSAATPAWGGATVRLVTDFIGDGVLLVPVPGSADTVKITGTTAANIAINALCDLGDEGAILRIPARGLGPVALQVAQESSTTGATIDTAIMAWSGAMPPVPADLILQALSG